jgi:hypothetical protein
MKARKMLLFEHQHAFAGAGEEGCDCAAAGAATNDEGIVKRLGHWMKNKPG